MPADVRTRRFDTELFDNIDQVRRKIRRSDLSRGLLAIACLVFGYALGASLVDLWLGGRNDGWPLAVRLVLFVGFLAGLVVLTGRVVHRYLTGVNPYYAARQLEETIPDAKNSIINWLDLKDQPLPPVIHQAVGMKAFKDSQQADPELIATPREFWKLAGGAAACLLGLLLLLIVVPRQFGSLMTRAFVPIAPGTLSTHATITVLKPGTGEVTVPAGQRVEFLATIAGSFPPANTPGAPALFYRYTTNDVPVRVPLEEDTLGQWGVRLSPDQLRTGLFWKMSAGDATTPEYPLKVRAQPFVLKWEATYTYRPYRKLGPETVVMPNELMPQPRLLGHRGTDVVLKAHTNAPVKSSSLELEIDGKKKLVAAVPNPAEPQVLAFRVPLEKSGTFRVLFDTAEGERNIDRTPYAIDVLEDVTPFVDLVKPGQDLEAPANGTVLLAGLAIDDFGVTGLTLQLQLGDKSGPRPLAPQPYKPKTPLKFVDGTYPVTVQYVDALYLDQLRGVDGKVLSLRAGQEITYWLEATDNNDFGRPNVGKSKTYKIVIKDGLVPSMQQKEERKEIQVQRDRHDKEQSNQREQQNDQKNQDKKGPGDNPNKDSGDKNDDKQDGSNNDGKSNDGKGNGPNDPKNDSKADPSGDGKNDAKNDGKNPQSKEAGANPKSDGADGGANSKPSPEQQQRDDLKNKLAKTADPINDALNSENPKNNDAPKDGKQEANSSNANDKSSGEKGNEKPKQGSAADPTNGPKDGKKSSGTEGVDSKDKSDPTAKDSPEKGGSSGSETSPADKKKPDDKKKNSGAGDGSSGGASDKKDAANLPGEDPSQTGAGKNTTAEGAGKKTDKTGPADVKEKGKTDNGKVVPGEKSPDGKARPEQAKGDEPKNTSSPKGDPKASKTPGKNDPSAKADDGKSGTGPDGEKKTEASFGKDDNAKEMKGEPTKDQVEALKKLLENGGDNPEADALAKELAKNGQDMKDQNLKKDLEKILGDAGREEDLKQLNGGNREIAPPPQQVGDGKGEKDKGNAPKEGITKNQGTEASPKTQAGGRGLSDELRAITPDEAFRRRMGNLQLENLDDVKKRVTPKILEKAKVTQEEWQRFLDNAQKYNELTRKIQKADDAKLLRGGAGKMSPQGVRAIDANPNAGGPVDGISARPPWEFSDAFREFTRKTKSP